MNRGVQWMVDVSANYPALADLMIYLSVGLGIVAIITAIWLFLASTMFKTLPSEAVTSGRLITILFAGSALISYGWTMASIGNALFDFGGGYVIDDFIDTQSLAVGSQVEANEVMKAFARSTLRILGTFFGLWGLVNIWTSRTPGGKMETFWAGVVRCVVGVVFAKPQEFLNIFGGLGDKFFG